MSSSPGGATAIQRLGDRVAEWANRWIPSPFIFALLLTALAYVAANVFTPDGPVQNVVNWYSGFWALLAFGMQMVLILVTGYAIAVSDAVSSWLERVASIPKDGKQAAVFVAAIAMIAGYIHWGIGLIVGAIIAIFVARAGHARDRTFHYPLLCAAGYTSLLIFNVGLSSSASLLSATEGHVFEDVIGVVPLSESVFTVYAAGLAVLTFVFILATVYLLAPEEHHATGIEEYAPGLLDEGEFEADGDEGDAPGDGSEDADGSEDVTESAVGGETRTPADALNRSRILAYGVAAGMFVYVVRHFATSGIGDALDLNVFNFLFIAVGLLLHGTPADYMDAIREGTEGAAGIILQFPFYAGILGIIANSGLGDMIATLLVGVSTPETFPVIAWLLAGFMNLFVPSAGGEWGVIGGIVGGAAVEQGVPAGQAVIAYSTGDMWTNMFQPFWALPLLGLTRMRARDILGYTLIFLVVMTPVYALGLYFLPY
ncbi:short-chain fatty acid transporter [Halopenitus salinus]|uniref:Short-chain fatty acid transporter n=1 Tax=Halopenitus salinus TaxID=1198295 RepID=A0ABD5UVN8_9EURY